MNLTCSFRVDALLFFFQWETSLNQLGELEFLVNQSLGDESIPVSKDHILISK